MTSPEAVPSNSPTAEFSALVMVAEGLMAVQPRPTSAPNADDVVVDVCVTGICGSDIHGLAGATGRRTVGQVMGHETAGTVVDIGNDVDEALLGASVCVNPVVSCGACPACRAGEQQQCAAAWVLGVRSDIDGAFAGRISVPARNVAVLPVGMPTWHGALVEPLAVGYHAVRRGGATPADRVLVIGGGPIGQAVVLGCRREGIETVVVSEFDPGRRSILDGLGGEAYSPDELDGAIRDRLSGSATLVLDAVGSGASLAAAMKHSQNGARIVLVGMESPQQNLNAYEISARERSIIGTFCYNAESFTSTVSWLASHPEVARLLVDSIMPLEDGPRVFQQLLAGTLRANKILLSPRPWDE